MPLDKEADYIRDYLLKPLLVMILELNTQLEKAKAIIAAKDVEIDHYKKKGIKVSKAHSTTKFDPNTFTEQMLSSDNFVRNIKQPITQFEGVCKIIYEQCINDVLANVKNRKNNEHSFQSCETQPRLESQISEEEADTAQTVPKGANSQSSHSSSEALSEFEHINKETTEEIKRKEELAKKLEDKKEKKLKQDLLTKKRKFV